MTARKLDRRQLLSTAATGLAALSAGLPLGCDEKAVPPSRREGPAAQDHAPVSRQAYTGPNVIIVRFGGGVRRRETISFPEKTFCPFIYHELARKRGVLFNNVDIASQPGVETSHGQGTLYILTGHYTHYEDITHKPFAARFEPAVPTLFEYFRRAYDVPEHQALLINGEDRIDEEFYTFSNHHLYGVSYRSTVLSLYRFKTYLLRQELADPGLGDKERGEKTAQLREMESKDYRVRDSKVVSPALDAFWEGWKGYYGRSGLVNPRGDRVLTALALRALRELRPRLMMINYQDPDYVHWGPPSFYTRAISIIDEGVREIHDAVQADDEEKGGTAYRDNTVFVVVPDCGRDNNRAMAVPFQHHFNSRSAHQIFAVLAGPPHLVPRAAGVITSPEQQSSIAATVGDLMGFPTPCADGPSLRAKA